MENDSEGNAEVLIICSPKEYNPSEETVYPLKEEIDSYLEKKQLQ